MGGIPVSILITTLNEEKNIGTCLQTLAGFDDVIIVDSQSTDKTCDIAQKYGAKVHHFKWDGTYPKKRQWILDHIQTKYDFILWLDADERLTPDFINHLQRCNFDKAGYFICASYVWNHKILRYGLKNKKLALMNRHKFLFPTVDDLDIKGMGEIEGHYQPVLKTDYNNEHIGTIKTPYIHDAYYDKQAWEDRHQRYAQWEAQMLTRDAYPQEGSRIRRFLKALFYSLPRRDWVAFVHSYFLKLGFLDGRAGLDFAKSRASYYKMVKHAQERLESQ